MMDQAVWVIRLTTNESIEVFGEPTVRDGVLRIIEWYGYGGQKREQMFSLANVLWWKKKMDV